MTDDANTIPTQGSTGEDDPGALLELSFGPSWARQAPGTNQTRPPVREHARSRREDRPRPPRREGPKPGGAHRRPHSGPRDEQRGRDRRRAAPPRQDARAEAERAPVNIRFLPDQKQLSALVRKLRTTNRAYPLIDLAALLRSNTDFCVAHIEVLRDHPETRLHQCRVCGAAVLDPSVLTLHLLRKHLADAFDEETTETQPPAGNFVCVARCGLSGMLLGPPNHNSYQDRVRQIHCLNFSHIPFDEYLAKAETVRDAELIEQWRQEASRQTRYRLKKGVEGESEPMEWNDASALFLKDIAPGLSTTTHRATVPAKLAQESEDPVLRQAARWAWQREQRFPASLLVAIRGALHHRDFTLFRAGSRVEFATPIVPSPLALDRAAPAIRDVLSFLQEHPGCSRSHILGALIPEHTPGDPATLEILSRVSWLIERGHIVEFFDHTLCVPLPAKTSNGRAAFSIPIEKTTAPTRPSAPPKTGSASAETTQPTAGPKQEPQEPVS